MKFFRHVSISLISFALAATSACTERGEPPSLAKRPFETQPASLAPQQIASQPSDAARIGRVAAFLDQARRGQIEFSEMLPKTEQACAAADGAAINSERWVVAQLALSRQGSLRDPVQTALANIDNEQRLLLLGGLPSDDQERLNIVQREIEDINKRQSEQLARLQSQLRT